MPLVWSRFCGFFFFLNEHFMMKGINLMFLIFCCPTGLHFLLCCWRFMPLSHSHLEVVVFEHGAMKNEPGKAWL